MELPDDVTREDLGRHVREVWVAWAQEQPAPKPSWLVPWEALGEPDREVDRRIGEALFWRGYDAGTDDAAAMPAQLEAQNKALRLALARLVAHPDAGTVEETIEHALTCAYCPQYRHRFVGPVAHLDECAITEGRRVLAESGGGEVSLTLPDPDKFQDMTKALALVQHAKDALRGAFVASRGRLASHEVWAAIDVLTDLEMVLDRRARQLQADMVAEVAALRAEVASLREDLADERKWAKHYSDLLEKTALDTTTTLETPA